MVSNSYQTVLDNSLSHLLVLGCCYWPHETPEYYATQNQTGGYQHGPLPAKPCYQPACTNQTLCNPCSNNSSYPLVTGAIINVPSPEPQTAIPVAKARFFSK